MRTVCACLFIVVLAKAAVVPQSLDVNDPYSGGKGNMGKGPGMGNMGKGNMGNMGKGPGMGNMGKVMPASSQIGDRLLRTFGVFKQQPLTVSAAQSQGWTSFTNGCTKFGIGYSQGGSGGPTKGSSAILYYTSGGQLSGFGSRMWGEPEESLVPEYWMPVSNGVYDLIIQTRDADTICSGETDGNLLGDQISVNGVLNIPLVMGEAQTAGWVEGNCIPKMGIHHAFDLNAPGQQTWNASSLVPVLPMYNPKTRAISAVLLASTDPQRIEVLGEWEGPFLNALMCKNWCANTGCTFPGVMLWTTMHWLFEDPKLNVCDGAKCVISL